LKVNELIDHVIGQWDIQLISYIFSPIDAQRIMRIPLNVGAFDDFVGWHFTSSWFFFGQIGMPFEIEPPVWRPSMH
jgi:hypothetical protein